MPHSKKHTQKTFWLFRYFDQRVSSKNQKLITKASHNTYIHLILLALVALYTFFPVFSMYFYADDFGDLYDLVHGKIVYDWTNISPQMFRYVFLQFLFRLFGLHAKGYYSVGVFMFILSVFAVYFFARKLFHNKKLGLAAGLIYATVPIGTGTVFMMTTFFTESGYPITIMLMAMLYVFLTYFQTRKLYWYGITLTLFFIFLNYNLRRGFMFAPILILFDYISNCKKLLPRFGILVRTLMFFFLVYFSNSLLPRLKDAVFHTHNWNYYDSHTKLLLLQHSFFEKSPYISLANILGSSGVLLRTQPNASLELIVHRSFWIGVIILSAIVLTGISWKVKHDWGLKMSFFLAWMFACILSFYVFSSPGISEITARSVTLAAPAYALFVALGGYSLYIFIDKTKRIPQQVLMSIFYIGFVAFIITNIHATHVVFNTFNSTRNQYAARFYIDLKSQLPNLPAGSLIYIQPDNNPQVRSLFYNIYKGSSYGVEGTIGMLYGRTYNQLTFADDYSLVEDFVGSDSAKINRVYSFNFSPDKLTNTSQEVRARLQSRK